MSERFLLDTHILLWAFNDDRRLPRKIRDILSDPEQVIFVSAASIWEISIKKSIGKLELPEDFFITFTDLRFQQLDVAFPHAKAVRSLPDIHKDPFDRMLIAQAIVEKMTLITIDKDMLCYDVAVLKI